MSLVRAKIRVVHHGREFIPDLEGRVIGLVVIPDLGRGVSWLCVGSFVGHWWLEVIVVGGEFFNYRYLGIRLKY